jgi:hypothetical protein
VLQTEAVLDVLTDEYVINTSNELCDAVVVSGGNCK